MRAEPERTATCGQLHCATWVWRRGSVILTPCNLRGELTSTVHVRMQRREAQMEEGGESIRVVLRQQTLQPCALLMYRRQVKRAAAFQLIREILPHWRA